MKPEPQKIRTAKFIGKIKLGTHEIEVAVLDDGERVITEEGLKSFFDLLENGSLTQPEAEQFFINLRNLNE